MASQNSVIRSRSEHPIIVADKPWELGAGLRAISVMPDPGHDRLRLYYLVWNRPDFTQNALCVAYSKDGLNWEKPDLGEGHNVVMRGSGLKMNWGVFFPNQVICDPAEEDADLRWKMAYWDRPTETSPCGFCFAVSPDGFAWRKLNDHPSITNVNDGCSLIAAPGPCPCPGLKSGYLLYQQTWKFNPNLPVDRDNLGGIHRRISLWTAGNFYDTWVGPILVLEPDELDPLDLQFYWLTAFPTKTGYGGFLWCHHTIDQTMDIQLVTSPDGWTWDRANDRQPILPVGAPGLFDCGSVASISGPMRVGDKTYILYCGRARTHDQALRCPDLPCPEPDEGIGIAEIEPGVLDIP